jgi:hypothetical protein
VVELPKKPGQFIQSVLQRGLRVALGTRTSDAPLTQPPRDGSTLWSWDSWVAN